MTSSELRNHALYHGVAASILLVCGVALAAASDAGARNVRGGSAHIAGPISSPSMLGGLSSLSGGDVTRQHQQHPRDLQASCKYGCEDLPCDLGCQSAFARCNHEVPLCFTNKTEPFFNATVHWGWSNPIACAGGSIECDLWIGAIDCNTTASASQRIGAVTIETDQNRVLYEITDEAYRISSVQVYFGTTDVPLLVDGSEYSISPEDFTVKYWFDPKAKGATVSTKDLIPGMYLIAHANVCPTDYGDEIPEVWVPAVNSSDPMCPMLAPDLCSNESSFEFSISNLFDTAPSFVPSYQPTPVAEGAGSLQPVESTCPFKCGDLSCNAECVDVFAYCSNAVCLGSDPAGLVSWGHSNPINCTGGSIQCELWTGDDCNHANGELIGHLTIDTDENKVTYNISDDNAWKVSSARIYVGASNNFEPYVQDAWFDPGEKDCVVEVYPDIHAGVFVIAQAFVCPASSDPADLATNPPNENVLLCPIPPKVPCPSSFPTSNLATEPPATSPDEPTAEPLIVTIFEPVIDLLVEILGEQSQTATNSPQGPLENPSLAPASPLTTVQPTPPDQNRGATPAPFQTDRTMSPARQPTISPRLPTSSPVRPTPTLRPAPPPLQPASPSLEPTLLTEERTNPPTINPTPFATPPPTSLPTEPPTAEPTEPPAVAPRPQPTDPPSFLS